MCWEVIVHIIATDHLIKIHQATILLEETMILKPIDYGIRATFLLVHNELQDTLLWTFNGMNDFLLEVLCLLNLSLCITHERSETLLRHELISLGENDVHNGMFIEDLVFGDIQ